MPLHSCRRIKSLPFLDTELTPCTCNASEWRPGCQGSCGERVCRSRALTPGVDVGMLRGVQRLVTPALGRGPWPVGAGVQCRGTNTLLCGAAFNSRSLGASQGQGLASVSFLLSSFSFCSYPFIPLLFPHSLYLGDSCSLFLGSSAAVICCRSVHFRVVLGAPES